MTVTEGRGPNQNLTHGSLNALLALLDSDREGAARRYDVIYRKLTHLFAWRGASVPEELADETLDRVARQAESGLRIQAEDPFRYISGVAFRVFHETLRREKRRLEKEQQLARETHREEIEAGHEEDCEPRMRCLDLCLEGMTEEDRNLILRYHQGERRVRIENRNSLARELGVAMNALRIRACRIRKRLQECTKKCVTKAGTS